MSGGLTPDLLPGTFVDPLFPIRKQYRKADEPALGIMSVLMMVVLLVLMVACANLANLLRARATGRQKEIAVRLAIGASRWRLVRQLLTECVLLALAGAAAGFVVAAVAARALSRFQLPAPFPIVFDFNVDWRVLAFTAGLSLMTALLFGLAPALHATRPDLPSASKACRSTLTNRCCSRKSAPRFWASSARSA